jgi:hypothetical protein
MKSSRPPLAVSILIAVLIVVSPGRSLAQPRFTVPDRVLREVRVNPVRAESSLRVISGARVTAIAPDRLSTLALKRGEFLAVKNTVMTQVVDGRQHYLFPTHTITTNDQGEFFDLQPFIEPTTSVLEQDPDGDTYSGRLMIGVTDLAQAASRNVPTSVWAVLTSNGPAVSRNQIPLVHTQAPYETVSVSGHVHGGGAKISMQIVGWPGGGRLDVEIPASRGAIVVTGVQQLPGLGVGQDEYTVRLDQSAGLAERSIALGVQNGRVDPRLVKVSGAKPALVKFRSQWLGAASISAEGGGNLESAPFKILLVFPTVFLITALIGGFVGSTIRALLASGRSGRELWGHAVAGILMGLVVACLYVLGVNVTSVPLPTQDNPLAIFAIAVIGSIALTQLFSAWSGAKALLGGKSE